MNGNYPVSKTMLVFSKLLENNIINSSAWLETFGTRFSVELTYTFPRKNREYKL